MPAVIAGHTGIGMSQRMQAFVLDAAENPFNLLEPGKRPRATLTPSLAFKDGKPWLAFAVQGGDTQDQNLLQFFLNIVEFGMTPQQAAEAPNFISFQMHDSFGAARDLPRPDPAQQLDPGLGAARVCARAATSSSTARAPRGRSTRSCSTTRTARSGARPSNHGEDYGIAW